MERVLIFGAGFLGTRCAREWSFATLAKADIADASAVEAAIRRHAPTAVLNCAGKTGSPNVDWCETHPVETYRSNVTGALVLAEACAKAGVYLLHIGSGCIFYGDSPAPGGWREDDFANPTSFYSRTKYAADLVLSRAPNVGIARVRMPIDSEPGPRNLISKLARYDQIIDVANSVTVIADLLPVLRGLLERRATGVFHTTNPGAMRHKDLIGLYRECVDPSHKCAFISAEELVAKGLAQKARSNCLLASPRLAEAGLAMRPIDVALAEAMRAYASAQRQGAGAPKGGAVAS